MGVVVRVLVLVLVLLVLLLVGVVRVVATVEDARPLSMMPAMAKRAACEDEASSPWWDCWGCWSRWCLWW